MIIGINGKIGSGKDTVGSIIQYLTDKNVTTETFEFWYASNFYSVYQSTGMFQIKKFAGKLKQIASLLTGIPVEMFEDQEFKKLEMPECWNRLQQSGRSKVWVPMTYRQFLQELGTEAMREGLHTNVWVNALFADYHLTPDKNANELFTEEFLTGSSTVRYELPNWIITDMRFPNEMEAVVERKGITIRVVREFYQFVDTEHEWSDREDRQGNVLRANATYSKEESNRVWRNSLKERAHASETALDDAKFDYEIINNGTIEDLIEKVRQILTIENII